MILLSASLGGVDSLTRLLELTAALLLAHPLGPGWFSVGSLLVMRLGEDGETGSLKRPAVNNEQTIKVAKSRKCHVT